MKRNFRQGQEDGKKHWPAPHHFEVHPCERFSGAFPFYRQPVEVGHFSLDGDRCYHNNARQLRYYKPPDTNERVGFNLRHGYDTAVIKSDEVQERLTFLLKWISLNRHKFATQEQLQSKEKITRLNTDFVGWRGHFTKLLCTPYEQREPWKMAATLYNGTIYLSEVETQYRINERQNRNARNEEMCYWGYKFEDYVTQPITEVEENDVVNTNEAFCSIIRTRLEKHSILCGAEVDCCVRGSQSKPPVNYIELKTSRIMQTQRQRENFCRFKLLRIWAQSFLAGLPQVIVGMRDDEGVVDHLVTYDTKNIPNECKRYHKQWNAPTTLNFLNQFLTWLKQLVVKDDPNFVYMLNFEHPFHRVTVDVIPDGSERFLPDWYLDH